MNASQPDVPSDLRSRYEPKLGLLKALAASLQVVVEETLADVPHIDRIAFRAKSVESFVQKAEDRRTDPPYTNPLAEIEDQVAGRVITFFRDDLDPIKQLLSSAFHAVEVSHKRPQKDEEFGYESHHLIFLIPPQVKPEGWDSQSDQPTTFEVQVRTLFMHAWSEPQHDLSYKGPADLPSDIRRELFWVAASAWGADQALSRVWKWQISNRVPPTDAAN